MATSSKTSRRGGTEQIRDLSWEAAEQSDPIEIFSLSDLMRRFRPEQLQAVERPQFHLVLIGQAGQGAHEVDFVETKMRPKRVLHIEPGQVHRWRHESRFEATLALFREAPANTGRGWGLGPRTVDLSDAQAAAVEVVLHLIVEERAAQRSPAAREVALAALRDLLVVRLGLDQDQASAEGDLPPAYVAFRNDLESHLSVDESMTDRASRLGYSARTISRACVDVSGRTAKQLADERLVLEARRLLAQPGAASSQVARVLGFTEQTNFAKFFRRHTDLTPSQWAATISPSH